jgi:hypothetical protein
MKERIETIVRARANIRGAWTTHIIVKRFYFKKENLCVLINIPKGGGE